MEKTKYNIPTLPLNLDLESKEILKQLALSSRALGELKGASDKIPNKNILISALTLVEAKESSEIENIITTNDELYMADLNIEKYAISSATKEVINYREAIAKGFELIVKKGMLTNNSIKEIQKVLEGNDAGFRSSSGTTLKDSRGNIVYTPPQDQNEIERLMQNFEEFVNNDALCDLDPIIKIAVIHHQFESIHPFYDGNGRTGRILCILFLVLKDLLDVPILYLSRYITQNKADYYRLLQEIRDKIDNEKEWQNWILFILKGVEETALSTLSLVTDIAKLMNDYKKVLRPEFAKVYKHELLNNLFFHPYTKIEFIERDMFVQRKTAMKYLEKIVGLGLLDKVKIGRSNYYINAKLIDLLINHQSYNPNNFDSIESVSRK